MSKLINLTQSIEDLENENSEVVDQIFNLSGIGIISSITQQRLINKSDYLQDNTNRIRLKKSKYLAIHNYIHRMKFWLYDLGPEFIVDFETVGLAYGLSVFTYVRYKGYVITIKPKGKLNIYTGNNSWLMCLNGKKPEYEWEWRWNGDTHLKVEELNNRHDDYPIRTKSKLFNHIAKGFAKLIDEKEGMC